MYRIWGFALVLVPCVAALSAVVLSAQYIFISYKVRVGAYVAVQVDGQPPHRKSTAWKDRVAEMGRNGTFSYKAVRLAAILALLVIAVVRVHGRTASALNVMICATYVGYNSATVFHLLMRDVRDTRPYWPSSMWPRTSQCGV